MRTAKRALVSLLAVLVSLLVKVQALESLLAKVQMSVSLLAKVQALAL